jgi:dihydroneopterin aldolase
MTLAGIVRVRGMRFWGRHGVTPEERDRPQEIEIDVELAVDCTAAGASDDIADAVDYTAVYEICERAATQTSFRLLEALAHACLHGIMADARIERATVRVRKPDLLAGATPEVEITRLRADRA